ncbi:MAG: metallophosphoesterase family protein [Fervidicoccaceae archaeon]
MKILQLGDIHCNVANLKRLREESASLQFDLLAVHGDVECNGDVVDLLKAISSSIVFVPGNMDDISIAKEFSRENFNIDSKVIELDNYVIAGIGGLSFYSSYTRVKEMLPLYRGRDIIILSHHPPLSTSTDLAMGSVHAGLPELRELDEEFGAILHMHGHIHESFGYEIIGQTLIVNPGALKSGRYALIDVEKRNVALMRLK